MSLLILVVDDEADVEVLFRQQFRRDLRAGRFTMEFAQSAPEALQRIADAAGVSLILILSDINMPGMSGLLLAAQSQSAVTGRSRYHHHRLRRRGQTKCRVLVGRFPGASDQADRLCTAPQ